MSNTNGIPLSDLKIETFRPNGLQVGCRDTGMRVTHLPSSMHIQADGSRMSQHRLLRALTAGLAMALLEMGEDVGSDDVPKFTPPRYDDVYADGVKWLDSL